MAATADGKSALGLSQAELRALEATRFRLQNLSNSLASFKNDLYMNKPLPTPRSLQTSATILNSHTTSLLQILTKHATLFQRLVIHPSTNYPGRAQENVLAQLLRKKLEPEIETLVEAARDEALAAGIHPSTSFVSQEQLLADRAREKQERRAAKFGGFAADDDDDDDDETEDEDDDGSGDYDEELENGEDGDGVNEPIGMGDAWVDARAWCRQRLERFIVEFGKDPYTPEERAMGIENVRTGLRMPLEMEESEEEDEDDDSDDDEGDTAMRDMAPIAPSSGQPAGQHALGGPQQYMGGMGPSPGEDPEWMLAFLARGDQELPKAMLEAQRRQFQRR